MLAIYGHNPWTSTEHFFILPHHRKKPASLRSQRLEKVRSERLSMPLPEDS
jgi:hypothetical protein